MPDEALIERIAVVNPVWADAMRSNPTNFAWESVPFYRKFQLLLATVNLPYQPLECRYADDGFRICVLRAAPEHIYAVNKLEALDLNVEQVPAYVRFFFDNLSGPRVAVVERTREVLWLDRVAAEPEMKALKEQAEPLIVPVQVTPLDGESYGVAATAVRGRRLITLDLLVRRNGHVEVKNERILVEKLPVVEVLP
jgi:hypothetical protein